MSAFGCPHCEGYGVEAETVEQLWEAQLREFPNSVRLTADEVYKWCDEAESTDGRLTRYMQVSMAIQFPTYVFYRIGEKHRGFRFGTDGAAYMSMYSN